MTLYRHFNTKNFPKIPESEIVKRLSIAVFECVDVTQFKQNEYFKDLSLIFKAQPAVLIKFKAVDQESFCQCVHWFGVGRYIYNEIKINTVIANLLNNKSLQENIMIKELTAGFLNYDYFLGKNIKDIKIKKENPWCLDGLLAEMAYTGGPYDEKLYPAEIAKIKASAFVNEIIQHRYNDFKVYEIIGAWSEWY